MVEANTPGTNIAAPPWEPQAFFTEEALRAAQEYWFQTHATNSRMIAEGRHAVGFMKSHIRRKLEREMGEDFKMYTGQTLGASSDGADSAGIRGELNQLLGQVYGKIAQGQPILSPIQEDLAILSHPLGGLEVCYVLVFFYTTLMQRYATLAGNRRKVLKSILDEELFKWVWRLTIAMLMSSDPRKFEFSESLLSTGLRQIPPDRQRATSAEKVLEVGQFLMGRLLAESHLRFPLAFYFNIYCRYIQTSLLSRYPPQQGESIYNAITSRQKGDGVSEVIIAIDEVMNTMGNSGQSFEDILKDEDAEVEKYIPPAEIEFIGQFREFTRDNIGASLKRVLPKGKPAGADGGASLMALLLILRTLPFYLRKNVLEKVPGPMLNLFLNRLQHAADEVSRGLANHIRETIDSRSKSGETYTLLRQDARRPTGYKTPAAKPAAPAEGAPAAGGPGRSAAPAAPPAPSAAPPRSAAPPAPSAPAAEPPGPRPSAAAPPAPPAPAAESRGPRPSTAAKPAAGDAARAPAQAAQAAQAAPAAPAADPFDQPVIVGWRIDGGQLSVETISARDLLRLAGPEARLLFQLVKFALQTGQVFRIPPGKVSKELLEELIARMIKQAPSDLAPLLSREERLAILEAGRNLSAKQLLATLVKKLQKADRPAGTLQQAMTSLSGKLGGRLADFLSNPGQEGFREVVQKLDSVERNAVGVLNRVARAS